MNCFSFLEDLQKWVAAPAQRPRVSSSWGSSFHIYQQCGHWRKAEKCGWPGRVYSRQICYQQMANTHAHCEKDNMLFINQLFSFQRFIIFAKMLGDISSLCVWPAGIGPRPDSIKGSGCQLLFVSRWFLCSCG